jgi:DnaK suppressor protein
MNIDLNYFREKLIAEKVQLEQQLSDIGMFNKETESWESIPETQEGPESDPNDLADRLENYEERSSMVKTFSSKLTDVLDALEKIESGKYGICEISGEQIELARLEANPAARTNKENRNS